MVINSFKISKLHGSLDFELLFKENTLILLGENGSCKTTIIQMLYYTLSLQWNKLSHYNFNKIEISIDGNKYEIKKDMLSPLITLEDKESNPKRIYFTDWTGEKTIKWSSDNYDLLELYDKNEISYHKLQRLSKNDKKELDKLSDINKILSNKLKDINIIYLPTYRRIEQELKDVLKGRVDEEEYRYRKSKEEESVNYTELIEFGMKDVDYSINNILNHLKESSRFNLNQLTLGYLGEIVDEKYSTTNAEAIKSIDENTIHDIMNRVEESILSEQRKERLSKALSSIKENGIGTDHDKVVCHYFLKLFESHKELIEKEQPIREFVEVCNRYIQNKSFIYDSPKFEFRIESQDDEHNIKLSQLSSGEKQIVSLFSHLYLTNKHNYLVLIDEPELSLSVKWQKTFLEDVRNGKFCDGLIAVTHSPFIFDNSLDHYACGIEAFKK